MPVKRGAFGALVVAMIVAAAVLRVAGPAGAAAVVQLPDLRTVIPTDSFSVVTTSTGKEFRYTHLIYNSGPGPLEVQPAYDPVSGQYRGTQEIFAQSGSSWSLASTHRVEDVFVYHAEHGHFHFPMASFGLYQVASGGGIGAPVAMSPKVGFCIDDSYIYDATVPNAGTFVGSKGSCADPTSLRGITVGAADEYDYRDPGQAIPFDGVPDGTYWFRAVTDPNNDFVEADESDNETDVLVTISGSTVTAGTVRHPDTTPPAAALDAPADGSTVSGTTTLRASAPAGTTRVDFMADGAVVGSATTAPYAVTWDTRTAIDGVHWLAARVVDGAGRIGTSSVAAVTVDNSGSPPATGGLATAGTTSTDGRGAVTTAPLTGLRGGEVVACLVGSDGPPTASQTTTVSGGGLAWTLVRRANAQAGTSEVWTARLPAGQTSIAATSTPAYGGFDQSVTLVAFENAAGIGASAARSAATGAPGVSLTTSTAGSLVLGAGNDWDRAVTRILGAGQTLVHEWVDTGTGDTFWVQRRSVATAGTTVSVDDSSPTDDRWNLAAVEVTAAPASGQDTTPPVVSINDPAAGATVSGSLTVAATAADDVGVTGVQFTLDGTPLGAPSTSPPFLTTWDTTTAGPGPHVLGAVATDAAGNHGTAAPVTVNVDNSAPPPAVIGLDAKVSSQGRSALVSPALSTAAPGELLVAFVATDGPLAPGAQTATVTGGGLTWSLVKRANTQAGDAEIWAATATGTLTNATVTATPLRSGYDGQLTVAAFANAAGAHIASTAGAPSGAPSVYLPGTAAGSWCFVVGNDWDRAIARTPSSGQMLQSQWVDTTVGDTFWLQSTTAPGSAPGLVTLGDTAPTSDQWNLAAVEILAKPSA